MARPKKKGVDYFPHDCNAGKTMFILEQKFGNDGYAFWYKLLEFLGTKEGHYLNRNNIPDMEFLQAKTHLSGEIIIKILDLLASLEAIDKELWGKGVVWSQRFVDGISDVYVNRRLKTPLKPSFYGVSTGHNQDNVEFSVKSTVKSTQSKVKESKVKDNTPIGVSGTDVPPTDSNKDLKKEYQEIITQQNGADSKTIFLAVKNFIDEKKPAFAEPYVDAWNIFAEKYGLTAVKQITKDRSDKIRCRAREPAFDFFKILGTIRQDSFYRGENGNGWKVDFNFIIRSEKNYTNLIEKFKEP